MERCKTAKSKFVSSQLIILFFLVYAVGKADQLTVDYADLVSRADLNYDKPVDRSEAGMPLGNGRMGSLVWTTPTALRLQINRVDVFGSNCSTNSFPERNTDYCGGCGFVDIEFPGYDDEVFSENHTTQHLSCYDGLVTTKGRGVEIRALAWYKQDVMAFEVTDRRNQPGSVRINLRMLRPETVKTMSHTANSKLEFRDNSINLRQAFEEDKYYCGSVVAAGISGREFKMQKLRDGELSLVLKPGNGTFTVFISSAAGFDKKENLSDRAVELLDTAVDNGFTGLLESNKTWWHNFWKKSFVCLHSDDGIAETVEKNYTYYLYVMASSSRGRFPTKFNGMLWTTGGDIRKWGGRFWGANQSCLYNALLTANRLELMDPMFDMYSGMYESCATAARQQWGSKGIYIPETVAFDGLEELPAEIAAETQALYLLRKPWEQRSEAFMDYAGTKVSFASRWNWKTGGKWQAGHWQFNDKGAGCFAHVNHIFSRGAKIAYQYWLRYEYTLDENWLRERAYPIIKGVAEFYRNYPNVKKGQDGKYHIHYVNSNESILGGRDTDEEIASMMGIMPVVIRASEILDMDADMRPVWREFLDNLAPLPTDSNPPVWIRALPPIVKGRGTGRPDGNTMPIWFFDLCTIENDNPETMKIANATFDGYLRGPTMRPGVLSKVPVTAAMMGRADAVRYLLPNQLLYPDRAPIMANRLDQREGTQTTNAQRLGRVADTLHNALLQSCGAGPAEKTVIRVFPAWPVQWDAAFTLLARGGLLVSSVMSESRIEFVQIVSQAEGECRLRNPWPHKSVSIYRNGRNSKTLNGDILIFATQKDETVLAAPTGTTLPVVTIP